jgi:hypothetical protein
MKASRQHIYNAVIHRMVQESLAAKHEAFAQEHAQDTTEQLVTYIRACAVRLGHSPHQKEVIGWPMLTERFGTWGNALRVARLPFPRTPNNPAQFALMLDEIEEQKRIYRERKAEKKIRAHKRMAEQARKQKEHPQATRKKRTAAPAAVEE